MRHIDLPTWRGVSTSLSYFMAVSPVVRSLGRQWPPMRLGAGLPRPPEIELSTLPTPSVNGTERLAGSACAGCCYLSAPSRRDVQWAPGVMQKAGCDPGESGPFRDDRSERLTTHSWRPINLRFSRAAEAFNPAFNTASASGCDLRGELPLSLPCAAFCTTFSVAGLITSQGPGFDADHTPMQPLPIRVSPRKGSGQFSSG